MWFLKEMPNTLERHTIDVITYDFFNSTQLLQLVISLESLL